jgi:hypothetical protein
MFSRKPEWIFLIFPIDNTPRHGFETPIASEHQGPGETMGGLMQMIFRNSPFASGVMTGRALSREYFLGWTFPNIDPPLGQPEEGGVYDPDSGMTFLLADIRAVTSINVCLILWEPASKGPGM